MTQLFFQKNNNTDDLNEYLNVPPENWQNWRTKSLNSSNLQRYSLPITPNSSSSSLNDQSRTKPIQQQSTAQKYIPKITKINESIFCIYLNNSLTLFSYIDEVQRQRRKIRNRFIKKTINSITLPNEVQWIYGDGTDNIFIASQNQILVLKIKMLTNRDVEVSQIWKNKFNKIKSMVVTISNLRKKFIVLTKDSVFIYQINGTSFQFMRELAISFSDQSSGWKDINKINGISIVVQSLNVFYFVGTSIQLKADVRMKLGREGDLKNQPAQKKCQALYLTRFQLTKTQAKARVFIIDHIFQIGIFKKSHVHQVGAQTFVLSLYQQIIVIRRNFSKFMVWDNVSIVSSKSNQKKGQLVLADKRIMVYTQSGQISAHQLYFNFSKAKLETPKIDSFKGNSNQQQILYDSLILQYKDETYMKILFYFKQLEVYIPNKKMITNQDQTSNTNQNKNQIFFQIMCIEQTQPNDKLKQLLQKNKSQEQIQSFLKRFNIKQLRYKKSQWEVSAKGQKQIETLLLNIKDNQYIQSELTKILKQKPHDLQFLLAVQKKQIERYRLMVASKILVYEQNHQYFNKNRKLQDNLAMITLSEYFNMRQLDQIKLAIQWLLQSKMFYQKLMYSMNFMSFKQYDFIEIGKLRTASLRQQIKLLGVKGYEKRLKYFLNSFKYLVLDDFKEILRFLIADLSENQLRIFFTKSFPFILPAYMQNQTEDRCKLWDNTFAQDQTHIQTINSFKKQVQQQMIKLFASVPPTFIRIPLKQGIQSFGNLFNQLMNQSWFIQNSYKQHSLLRHNIQQLKHSFKQLKQIQVCNTIVQLAQQKIHTKQFTENKVNFLIHTLGKQKYLSQQYIMNIQSRLQIYTFIQKQIAKDPKKYDNILYKRSEFIILKQSVYFQFLFQYFDKFLVSQIKAIYQKRKNNLYLGNMRKFLYSDLPKLDKLIKFIDNFQNHTDSDDIKLEIFKCICNMMPITDLSNCRLLIKKLKQMPVGLKTKNIQIKSKLLPQAKVACSINFIPFFMHFEIKQNYSQLLLQTQSSTLQQTKIFSTLITNYIQSYNPKHPSPLIFQKQQVIDFILPQIDMCQIVDFLSIMLYLHDILNYQFKRQNILKYLIVGFIELQMFQYLTQIVQEIIQFGKMFDDRELIEKYGNYRVLNQYKQQNNVKKQFQQIMQEWISEKYKWLVNLKQQPIQKQTKSKQSQSQTYLTQQTIKKSFFSISSVLKILNYYNFNQAVQLQISRLSLYQNIKKISQNLLILTLPHLILHQKSYIEITSFTFLLNLLQKIPNRSQLFSIQQREKILQYLSYFIKIQREYEQVYHKKNKKNQQIIFGQLCRFNSQMVITLVKQGYTRMAGFVIIDLINSTYYYRDVVFYFIARLIDIKKIGVKPLQKFVYEFMTIDNLQDLKKILSSFIVKYQLSNVIQPSLFSNNILFIFTQILKNSQLDEAFYFALRNTEVQPSQFERIALEMNKYRQDHIITQTLLITFMRAAKQKIEGQNWPTFMIYRRKINSLLKANQRMDVIKDIAIVMGQLEIDDLKAKIKIMQENQQSHKSMKLYIDQTSKTLQNGQPQEYKQTGFEKLKKYYQKYMISQNLNPWLALNTQQMLPSAIRIQKYPEYSVKQRESKEQYYKILPLIREEQSVQVKQLRKKLFVNQQRLKQIQTGNRKLLGQDIMPGISQVKKKAQKQYLSLLQRKKIKKEQEERQQNQKQKNKQKEIGSKVQIQQNDEEINIDIKSQNNIQKLNEKQKQKINENKKTYRSKIVEQTQNLLTELRQKRKKVRQESTVTFGTEQGVRKEDKRQDSDHKSNTVIKNGKNNFYYAEGRQDVRSSASGASIKVSQKDKKQDIQKGMVFGSRQDLKDRLDMIRGGNLKNIAISRMMADKNGQFYVPRWQPKVPMRQKFEQLLQDKPKKTGQYIQKAKKQLAEENKKTQKIKAQKQKSKKLTIKQLLQKHKQLNQPFVVQQIQKISLIQNNPKSCGEMIKNIYLRTKQIKNFIQLLKDLLATNQLACEYIQHKSIKLVEQSMRIKVTIQFKQIFPPNLFTNIHNISMRDYYLIAYDIIRPNIIKLMQQPNYNVNALSMMIRYGFGSDSTYYYKVYQDYIYSLLQNYQAKSQLIFTQKDIIQLAEKLRTNYNNLNPSQKKLKFIQLVQDIKSIDKRKALIKSLINNLENKSSMINKENYQQFRLVLSKLENEVL